MYDERSGGDVCLQAIFGQVHMDAKPTLKDSTGALYPYYPNEARIRNLTYQIEASVDFTIEKRRRYGNKPGTAKEDLIETYETKEKTTLCKIPVMVHSKPCQLYGQTPKMIMRKKECLYDQGGYFVINGSEKVIVAQERQACNIVLVFNVKLNSKYSWNAQIRSQNEQSNKPALQFKVNIEKAEKGGHIMATIPKIRSDVPIVILFRALGCTSDEQIFNMVMTDPNDTPMSEALRPSLEQAKGYYTQEQCLDFIAQLGGPLSLIEANRDGTERTGIQKKQMRIKFAQSVLRDDLLPHVGIKAGDEYKKAFFAGYMTNRLIQAALGRTTEDDRDYYGKKRMDMAGSLLAMIFRQEFRKVITDM